MASSDLDNDLSFDCAAVGHPTSSDRQPWIPDAITWKVMTLQPHVAIPDSIKAAACTSDKHDKENQSVDDESWSQSMPKLVNWFRYWIEEGRAIGRDIHDFFLLVKTRYQ